MNVPDWIKLLITDDGLCRSAVEAITNLARRGSLLAGTTSSSACKSKKRSWASDRLRVGVVEAPAVNVAVPTADPAASTPSLSVNFAVPVVAFAMHRNRIGVCTQTDALHRQPF
jgi:hypothetical protein